MMFCDDNREDPGGQFAALVAEAKMAVFDFIEAWYNPHRRHSALGQLSPLSYERRHASAA